MQTYTILTVIAISYLSMGYFEVRNISIIENIVFAGGPPDASDIFYNFSKATHGRGSLVVNGIKNSLKKSVVIPSYLSAETYTIHFDYGGQQELPVWSNINWTISSSDPWLTVSRTSGSNNRTVTVTAAKNTTSSERKATITLSGTGVATQTVTVTQGKQPNESWTITPTLTAKLEGEGILTITSTQSDERLPDYTLVNHPWHEMREKVRSIKFINCLPNFYDLVFFDKFSNLNDLTYPQVMSSLRQRPYRCPQLTSIQIDDKNPYFTSENGILYNKDKSVLLVCPAGKKGTFTIPSSVKTIGEYSFRNSQLSEVIIPNSVTKIETYAFWGSGNLTAVTIPNSVTTIAQSAFYNCYALKSVIISNSVTTIEPLTFSDCSNLSSVTIPASVTQIKDRAFFQSSPLSEITVGWTTPIVVSHADQLFWNSIFERATLRVPAGTKALYEKAPLWRDFPKIVEYSPVGNEVIKAPESASDAAGLSAYTVNGILHISGLRTRETFAVYSITGQLVYKGMAAANEAQVALHSRGLYIVTASDGQSKRAIKVIH